jgi:hypothetical protein
MSIALMGLAVVVDADVARAASAEPVDDKALAGADALAIVLESNAYVVFDSITEAEWARHAGRFATTWQVEIESRKRTIRPDLAAGSLPSVVSALTAALKQPTELAARKKDAHLLAAALDVPCAVVSGDVRSRNGFRALCHTQPPWHDVLWFSMPGENNDLRHWCLGAGPGVRLCL